MYQLMSILILSVICGCCAFVSKPVIVNDVEIARKWELALKDLDALAFRDRDTVINSIDRLTQSNQISKPCLDSLITIKHGLTSHQKFAYNFLDASSRSSNLFAFGYVSSLGSRTDCLNLNVRLERAPGFSGQYCIAKVRLPLHGINFRELHEYHLNISSSELLQQSLFADYTQTLSYFKDYGFNFGVCVPSTCSIGDIATAAKQLFPFKDLRLEIGDQCHVNDDAKPWSFGAKLSYCFLSATFLAVLACSLSRPRDSHSFLDKLRNAMSIQSNMDKLCTVKGGTFAPVETMRFFFQFYAIIGHLFFAVIGHPSPARECSWSMTCLI